MWIEELALHLREAEIAGLGNEIYAFTMREGIKGAMITSANSGMMADNELPGLYRGSFQVVVRAYSIRDAYDTSIALINALNSHKKKEDGLAAAFELPTIIVNYIYPRHLPVIFPRSDGAFYEASINFDICFLEK